MKPATLFDRCVFAWIVLLAGLAFRSGQATAQAPSMLDPTATQAAAGVDHSCALTTAGGVKCWGNNDFGQLGDGSTTQRNTPADVMGLGSGVAAIAAGGNHNCALTTAGAVQCWGYNAYGQLGDGSNIQRTTPVAVAGLGSGVVAIAASGNHNCALTTAGAVKCWGWNLTGQLGDGSTTNRTRPVDVVGLTSGVLAIAAGRHHSCALTTAGGMKCWGYNDNGELGDGSTTDRPTPVDVAGLGSGVLAIAVGYYHSCALTTSGGTKCWGYNDDGQLGDDSTTNRPTPVDVAGLGSGVAAITAGQRHTCALITGGGVKCWGYNSDGQLGDGSTTNRTTPVDVLGLGSSVAAAIAAAYAHTCAVTTVGGVKCWGNNFYAQLGDGSTTRRLTPVDVAGFSSGVAVIAAGGAHSCALTTTGGTKCWGNNFYGQLGDGSTTQRNVPVDVIGLGSGVAAVAAGRIHSCAVTTAGGAKCWGWNGDGQLGDGSTTERHTAVDVAGLASGVAAVAVGQFHSCAVTTAGGAKCWGRNDDGQLGDGSTTQRITPVDVVGLGSGVVAITLGVRHSCALTTAGSTKCWGRNSGGELGDGGSANSSAPVYVRLGSVAAIAAGYYHTCAVTTTGGVKCWGYNDVGQLGDGSEGGRSSMPVDVVGLGSGVEAIAGGAFHSCALTTAGGMKCWGNNDDGQLGDGGEVERSGTPVDVAGLASGVVAITAGFADACALTIAGGANCWGENGNGQLGDGSTVERHVPVAVQGGQALAFAPPTTLPVGGSATLAASASGPGVAPIVFDTWTPATCAIAADALSITGAPGSLCGVRASRAGESLADGGSTAGAPQQLRLIQIARIAPALAVTSHLNPSTYGQDVAFTAMLTGAVTPTGDVTFCADASSTDASCSGGALLCTVAASTTPIACSTAALGAGSHAISAYFAGDANHAPAAAPALTQTVNPAPQAITDLAATPANPVYAPGGAFTVSANGGASGNAVVFAIDASTSSVCSAAGATIATLRAGTCTVLADQPGSANYSAAPQVSLDVVIAPRIFTVAPSIGAGSGGISPDTPQSVVEGGTATFTLSPATGYRVDTVGGTCGGALSADSYQTSPVAGDCTVIANFALLSYTVSATSAGHGAITPATQAVDHGGTVSFTVAPDAGYHVASVTGDTCMPVAGAGEQWTAPNITADCAVTAAFAIDIFTVTATADPNGAITPATQAVDHGGTASFTVVPGTGYHVASVTGDTCAPVQGAGEQWTAPNITADCAVTASFAVDPADLALTIDDGRAYARYGQLLTYVVTLKNRGSGPADTASIAMTLPPELDANYTTWICAGAGAGANCTAQGQGELVDMSVTLPAGRSLTWLVTAPVRRDAVGPIVETRVTASDGVNSVDANDQTALVILRTGFDVPYGDGAEGADWRVDLARCAATAEPVALDEAFLHRFVLPAAGESLFETLLAARAADGSDLRIERANPGADWLRLVAMDAQGVEQASQWTAAAPGAALMLAVADIGAGQRAVLLEGANAPLSLPLPNGMQRVQVRSRMGPDGHCD